MISTPPHSNRRRNGRSHHSLKTVHAYSVENELQAKNHLPTSNLEQGWVIDSGASTHMTPLKGTAMTFKVQIGESILQMDHQSYVKILAP